MRDVRPPIISKQQMYSLLSSGQLGNTIPQYFSVADWEESDDYHLKARWCVRTLTPGGPCLLDLPRDDVRSVAESFRPHGVNISIMVASVTRNTLMADVWVGTHGLEVYGIEWPAVDANWRRDMPRMGRTFRLLAARGVLARHLNDCDRADLDELLDLYPGHVVELSAYDRCVGIYPHRKAVIWEVRCDSGEYEQPSWKQHGIVPRYQRGWSRDGD
jgi:hypothetical protein